MTKYVFLIILVCFHATRCRSLENNKIQMHLSMKIHVELEGETEGSALY